MIPTSEESLVLLTQQMSELIVLSQDILQNLMWVLELMQYCLATVGLVFTIWVVYKFFWSVMGFGSA